MDKQRIADALTRVPPFTSPRVRRRVLGARQDVRRARRLAYERFGSDRLSRPAAFALDRRLEAHLPSRPGFFVEAGAHDGFTQSNTYYLERFKGWRGVLVEPVPELYRRCVRERPGARVFNCALVAPGHPEDTVTMRYGDLQSVVGGAWGEVRTGEGTERQEDWSRRGCHRGWAQPYDVTVPARTLDSLLAEAGAPAIDFMSLDVEGYEAEVLKGLDLERHGPALLLLEMFETFGASLADVEHQLGDRYRLLERMSPQDLLYARV